MGVGVVAVVVVSVFWGIIGIICPFLFGRGPNAGVIRSCLVLIAACSWLFWLCCYMHQMNPLIGPSMHAETLMALKYLWDGDRDFLNNTTSSSTASLSTIDTTISAQ